MRVSVVIPALNEEESIVKVLRDLPRDTVQEIVVVDNGSTDGTAAVAAREGARVISEPRRGYGQACLTGIAACSPHEVTVFLDADYSDYPEDIRLLLEPLRNNEADLVIGSRMGAGREALLPQAFFGNKLACFLMRIFFGARFTDLGPFRAIGSESLARLGMADRNFGWTVEMQVKAVRKGLRCTEVPVRYRKRIGKSKITGTVSGTIRAGAKILYTIFRLRLFPG